MPAAMSAHPCRPPAAFDQVSGGLTSSAALERGYGEPLVSDPNSRVLVDEVSTAGSYSGSQRAATTRCSKGRARASGGVAGDTQPQGVGAVPDAGSRVSPAGCVGPG